MTRKRSRVSQGDRVGKAAIESTSESLQQGDSIYVFLENVLVLTAIAGIHAAGAWLRGRGHSKK